MRKSWDVPPRADEFNVVPDNGSYYVNGTQHEWWWFKTFVLKIQNKRTGDIFKERCIGIKLPIWGMYYCIACDDEKWGQLTFQYRGIRGSFFGAVSPPHSLVSKNG